MDKAISTFLIITGWIILTLSILWGILGTVLFILELNEPISSGNLGATGFVLATFWISSFLALILITIGNKISNKKHIKFFKASLIFLSFHVILVASLTFAFPGSKGWIWSSANEGGTEETSSDGINTWSKLLKKNNK